jgi:osmotically-inducible protein OsmY
MKNNQAIELKVIKELNSDPLLTPIASAIRVVATDNVVSLSGQVASHLLRNAAEEAALRVDEVEAVAMEIEVINS